MSHRGRGFDQGGRGSGRVRRPDRARGPDGSRGPPRGGNNALPFRQQDQQTSRGSGQESRGRGRAGSRGGYSQHTRPFPVQSTTFQPDRDRYAPVPRIDSSLYAPNVTEASQPNMSVQHHEDSIQKRQTNGGDHNVGFGSIDLGGTNFNAVTPRRPGYGTAGDPVNLFTNHMTLGAKSLQVWEYDISISGDPPRRKKQRLVEQLLANGLAYYKGKLATDFAKKLYSTEELPASILDPRNRAQLLGAASDPVLRLDSRGLVPFSALGASMNSTAKFAIFNDKERVLQALNIILAHFVKSTSLANHPMVMTAGANIFCNIRDNHPHDLGAGLVVWTGFFMSVKVAASRLLLNVQIKHIAAYDDLPLPFLIQSFFGRSAPDYDHLGRFLRLVRITTDHIPKDKEKPWTLDQKPKTIIGLPELAPDTEYRRQLELPLVSGPTASRVHFHLGPDRGSDVRSDGLPVQYYTVTSYFARMYNKEILTTGYNDVVVNTGNKEKPVFLPAQVCHVLPAQPARARLSPVQTSRMMSWAVRFPGQNARSIVAQGFPTLGLQPSEAILGTFGLHPHNQLLKVSGRVLPSPSVSYMYDKPKEPFRGGWDLRNVKFHTGNKLGYWAVIAVTDQDKRNTAYMDAKKWRDACITEFQRALTNSYGVGAQQLTPLRASCQLGDTSTQTKRNVQAAFETIQGKAREQPKPTPVKFILVLLPTTDTAAYDEIKRQGDLKMGIQTLCVRGNLFVNLKTLRPTAQPPSGEQEPEMEGQFDQQLFGNLAMKVNLKARGVNQTLKSQHLGVIGKGKTMVVGIDVTHPSPTSKLTARSLAATVASVDSVLAHWPALLCMQNRRQEIVERLDMMLQLHLKKWRAKNGTLPDNILVYRDGVSESQYAEVLSSELQRMKKGCAEVYKGRSMPRFSIIVVGKRHNTRFYPTPEMNGNQKVMDIKSTNCRHGTVVDRGITEPRDWDFFLQSHNALKGTAKPAHYYVVHDEIFRKSQDGGSEQEGRDSANALEALTHNMCHLFARATKIVSVCPPAYYADLAAERGRKYMCGAFELASPQTVQEAEADCVDPNTDLITVHPNIEDTMFYL
ncbi:MAG: hypothetical protein M1828_001783 [Chrysothrix sp. TS-e1954]|nr:MAG: hypothetical protein M1828_001783 [Chrysothrix sp. TS-e1954]